MPGLEIKVQGDDAPAVFRKGVLITGVTASAARDRSYELTFTAIPYSERYGYRPALIPCPVMAGTLPARVTSTVKNDIYAHIDKDGRYRVNLDFDRDTWKPGYESLWVRQSRPYAGDTYGLHLPLLAGTEVSIAFEEGNPDRPYIAGVKHDSAHTDHVTIQNYKRNVLRTRRTTKSASMTSAAKSISRSVPSMAARASSTSAIWWMPENSSAGKALNCVPICGVQYGQRKASLSAPTRRTRRRVRCAKWLRRWQYWMAHSHR